MDNGYTKTLAELVAETSFEDLPSEVVHQAKRLILDTIGCVFGGYVTDPGPIVRSVISELGGVPESTVVGSKDKTSCTNATYFNSRAANILDADDNFYTSTHFGTTSVCAPLAVGERHQSSGKDLITSVVLAFDLAARFSMVIGSPHMVADARQPDFGRFTIVETLNLSSAVGASKAHGLTAEQISHAIGIAGVNTPIKTKYPLLELYPRPLVAPHFKYADYGWCGMAGVFAALLAKKGFTSFPRILDTDSAFWNRFEMEKNFDLLTKELGHKWHISFTNFKPWPSCRWTHSALTALSKILDDNQIQPEEVEEVVIYGSSATERFRSAERGSVLSYQGTYPHPATMVVHRVPPGPLWYTEDALKNPKYTEFRKRIKSSVHPRAADMAKWVVDGQRRKTPGGAEVVARGKRFQYDTDYIKGDTFQKETYFTDEELKKKFRDMGTPMAMASESWQEQINLIIDTVFNLEALDDINDLTMLLVP